MLVGKILCCLDVVTEILVWSPFFRVKMTKKQNQDIGLDCDTEYLYITSSFNVAPWIHRHGWDLRNSFSPSALSTVFFIYPFPSKWKLGINQGFRTCVMRRPQPFVAASHTLMMALPVLNTEERWLFSTPFNVVTPKEHLNVVICGNLQICFPLNCCLDTIQYPQYSNYCI